jgi:uncharacterized membrane protein YedE/YeeE
MQLFYTLLGIAFGIILTKSEVISWFRIRKMFLFQEAHMYLIIGSAVVVGAISIKLLKMFSLKSLNNEKISYEGKKYQKGFIYGGLLFGIGWAITGACPGPIFAQIGSGAFPAIVTLFGALTGSYIYHIVKAKLPR